MVGMYAWVDVGRTTLRVVGTATLRSPGNADASLGGHEASPRVHAKVYSARSAYSPSNASASPASGAKPCPCAQRTSPQATRSVANATRGFISLTITFIFFRDNGPHDWERDANPNRTRIQ